MRVTVRRRLFILHSYLGIAAASVLFVVAVSGAVLAFRSDLERMLGPDIAWDGTGVVEWERIRDAARSARPDGRLQMLWFPTANRPYFTAAFAIGSREYTDPILFHPISGDRIRGPSAQWLDQIETLHENLNLGAFGAMLVRWSGPVLLLLLSSGTLLAWSGRRNVSLLSISRGRRLWPDLHRVVGILATPCAILMIWTAAVWSFPDRVQPWIYALVGEPWTGEPDGDLWRLPSVVPATVPVEEIESAAGSVLIERAFELCGRNGRVDYLSFPIRSDENRQVRILLSSEPGRYETPCVAYFDRYSGTLLALADPSRGWASRYLREWNERLHVGEVGGRWGRVLWFLSALGVAFLAASGIWLRLRRATRPALFRRVK